jgi:hypothetical protein
VMDIHAMTKPYRRILSPRQHNPARRRPAPVALVSSQRVTRCREGSATISGRPNLADDFHLRDSGALLLGSKPAASPL